MKRIIGFKLLREDGSSLRPTGRVTYPLGEWISVPGNGAYVATSDGLDAGGVGPLLAQMECSEPTGASAPDGVVCYRHVKRLSGVPGRDPWEAYQKARATAYEAYQKAIAPAYEAYQKARATAWGRLVAAATSKKTKE